jgi:hypothetical protein
MSAWLAIRRITMMRVDEAIAELVEYLIGHCPEHARYYFDDFYEDRYIHHNRSIIEMTHSIFAFVYY